MNKTSGWLALSALATGRGREGLSCYPSSDHEPIPASVTMLAASAPGRLSAIEAMPTAKGGASPKTINVAPFAPFGNTEAAPPRKSPRYGWTTEGGSKIRHFSLN